MTGDQIALLQSLALSAAAAFDSSEQPEAELARLRRLAVVDEMLSPLAGVLDLREVFKRTSQIAGQVLAHDAITVLLLTDDRQQVVPYAMAGPAASQPPAPHPFGHIIGPAGDEAMQRRVILQALEVLEKADGPGTIEHFQEPWPEPLELARRRSEPEAPPPIAAQMGRYIGKFLMGMRRGS